MTVMPRLLWSLLLLCCMVFSVAMPAKADLATSLASEYHTQEELGACVMVKGGAADLAAVLADTKNKILIWQIPFESYDAACTPMILDWVRAGHTFWFYDSRYAPFFGMKPYTLRGNQFRGRPEDGVLGEVKYSGIACAVMAMGSHPVITGVGQATVFVPAIGDDTYSAVTVAGDTVGLLQFALDSPAVAALRRDGRGLIVFKQLLWVKSLSGERFQMNLLEFSGGRGVPGTGGEGRFGELIGPNGVWVEGKPAVSLADGSGADVAAGADVTEVREGAESHFGSDGSYVRAQPLSQDSEAKPSTGKQGKAAKSSERHKVSDKHRGKAEGAHVGEDVRTAQPEEADAASVWCDSVTTSSGAVTPGKILNEEISFEGGTSSLKLRTDEVSSITVGQHGMLDRIVLANGQEYSGFWMVDKVVLQTADGDQVYSKRELLRISVSTADGAH